MVAGPPGNRGHASPLLPVAWRSARSRGDDLGYLVACFGLSPGAGPLEPSVPGEAGGPTLLA